ncbi:MAG: hypothetical protein C0602_10365 [Denitrovibrio sp.]|nr:MAG: hypothetical protein C0602_10365 [Denitrovibrio sp.]
MINEQKQLTANILTPLLENSSDSVVVTDKNLKVVLWNKNSSILFGYSHEEAIGKYVYELFFPEEYAGKYLEEFDIYKDKNHSYLNPKITERIYITKDKKYFTAKIKLFDVSEDDEWWSVGIINEVSNVESIAEKLKSSEEMFKLAMESTQDGFFICDAISNEVYFSSRWKEMLGYTDEEIPNQFSEWEVRTIEEDKEKVLEKFNQIFTDHLEWFSFKFRMIHKEGHIVFVHARGQILYDSYGNAVKIIGTHTDITKQMKIENKLKKLSEVAKQSPISIIMTDMNAVIEYVNPYFTQVTGYSEEEAIGRRAPELMRTQPDETVLKDMFSSVKSGRTWKGEVISLKKNGDRLIESATMSPFYNAQGQLTNILVAMEDITEKRATEQMINENEQKLFQAEKVAQLGHYTLYVAENKWIASREICNLLGLDWKEKLLIEEWANLIHPDDKEEMIGYLTTEVMGKKKPFDKEYRVVNAKTGETRWVHGIGELTIGSNGEVTQMAGIIQDTTDRKELELSLRELNVNLQEKVDAEIKKVRLQENIIQQQKRFVDMGQMVNAIAHQWRQPLNNIQLLMQMLKEIQEGVDYGDLESVDLFKKHQEQVMFMSETIDDFRNFFSSNKKKEDFSVKSEIKKITSLLSPQLSSCSIQLQLECSCADMPVPCNLDEYDSCRFENDVINGSSAELRHVLLNILNNAKDAILEKSSGENIKGIIKINMASDEKCFHISIFNSGSPIDDAVMLKIFEPYFSTKDEGKGTGIGLFMSKLIVENEFKGKLYPENMENGVCFHIELPKWK